MSGQNGIHQDGAGRDGEACLPVFLKLKGRKVLLVGGGRVACARLPELVRTGALVTIVAPEVRPEIATVDGLIIVRRAFVASDLDHVWFVVAAATAEVNRRVAEAADERGVFVNAVDDADRASAYMGGVLRRGGTTIAISTEGRAPALAGLLREGIEALVPDDIEAWVIEARWLRQEQRATGVDMRDRRPLLLTALNRLYEARAMASEAR